MLASTSSQNLFVSSSSELRSTFICSYDVDGWLLSTDSRCPDSGPSSTSVTYSTTSSSSLSSASSSSNSYYCSYNSYGDLLYYSSSHCPKTGDLSSSVLWYTYTFPASSPTPTSSSTCDGLLTTDGACLHWNNMYYDVFSDQYYKNMNIAGAHGSRGPNTEQAIALGCCEVS